MKICDDNDHGEIAHEGRECPACKRIEELESEVDDAEEKIAKLEDEIQALLN